MIFAIDVGNTNIVLGCIEPGKTHFIERLSTVRTRTEMEYAVAFKNLLELNGIDCGKIEGAIICSVVPQLTWILEKAVDKVLHFMPLVVGPGIRTGLNILMDNPASVGADLVAAAVAGAELYPLPLILIDMGTATTVTVVDEHKCYIGGLIYPGLMISLDALTARASQLGGIGLERPKKVIGKNTLDSMKSGILYSNAAALDGIIDRIEEELGKSCCVVATGGLASRVVPCCKKKIRLDDDLILKGLLFIYERNC